MPFFSFQWAPALAPLLPLPLTTSTPPTPPDATARWVTRRQSSRSRGATATRAVRAGASRGPAKPSLHLRTGVSECFTRTLCNASPGPYHFPCGCLLDDSRHPRPICYCSANGLVLFDTSTRQGRQKQRNTSCHLLWVIEYRVGSTPQRPIRHHSVDGLSMPIRFLSQWYLPA